jgi:glycosyltransferase involved in cell wall biosynthesis
MNVAITVSREDEFTLKRRGLENVLFVANGATRRLWKAGERETERKRIRSLWNVELGGITDDTHVVGMLARLSAEKRHLYFLHTLACLREKHPSLKWRFLAFGSGTMEQSLRAEAKRLGIDNACHWMGYRPDAAGLVPGLDLVAFSSQAEGFPIAAIEAGWAGVPIFASNVGALPELVSTGRTAGGLIFPREQEPRHTAESLAWPLGHPKERERLGTRLQNRVAREYSAQAWVGRMEELYRTI